MSALSLVCCAPTEVQKPYLYQRDKDPPYTTLTDIHLLPICFKLQKSSGRNCLFWSLSIFLINFFKGEADQEKNRSSVFWLVRVICHAH